MTSPAPASQPTPTEADMERAESLYETITETEWADDVELLIAQALADQRAELVGRYEDVISDIETWDDPLVVAAVELLREVGQ